MQLSRPVRIDPTFTLEFDHSPQIVSAEFSSSGDVVYVHMHTPAVDLWRLLVHYWPEWAGVVVGLLLLVITWRVLWVRANRQTKGEPHCRRCNYNLRAHVDAGDGATAVCPECGLDFHKRAPRQGRTTIRRIAIIAVVTLVVTATYGLCLGLGAPRQGVVSNWQFWPSMRLAAWTIEKDVGWLKPFMDFADRIATIDSDSGIELRSIMLKGATYERLVFHPNGRDVFRASDYGSVLIECVDLRSGRRRASAKNIVDRLGRMPHWNSPIVAFCDAGESVLITGRVGRKSVVRSWNRTTGEIRTLIEESMPETSRPDTLIVVANRLVDPDRLVMTSGFAESYERRIARVVVYNLAPNLARLGEYEFPSGSTTALTPMISTGAAPVVTPDGKMAFIGAGSVRAAVLGINLDTGESAGLLAPPSMFNNAWHDMDLSGDGRFLAVGMMSQAFDFVAVRDIERRAWIAACRADVVNPVPSLSADGRRLAAVGFKRGAAPRGPYVHVLFVFDLSGIVDARPADETP